MRSKAEILFDAITGIREELVEEAQNHVFRRRPARWRRYAPLAACLALVVLLGYSGMLLSCRKGGVDFNTSGAPQSPAAPPVYGDYGGGCAPADTAPRPPLGGGSPEEGGAVDAPTGEPAPGGGVEERTFTARVAEIRPDCLVAEPEPGGALEAGLVEIPLEGLELPPEVQPGSLVSVTFAGEVEAGEPARIGGVLEIVPME